MRTFLLLFFSIFTINGLCAQSTDKIEVLAVVVDGDTIPVVNLRSVSIVEKRSFRDKQAQKKYEKLVRDVKKVYPYAKLAGNKMRVYNDQLLQAKNDSERKRLMKKAEDEIKAEFTDDIEDMTMTQGKILLKLIDRETGQNGYMLVKDLRGTFSAFFWQSVARIFSTDLKAEYDPYGEDKRIEEIIYLIETGQI